MVKEMLKGKGRFLFALLTSGLFLLNACKDTLPPGYVRPTDTVTSGTVHISADETFKPVIDQQIEAFQAQYPKAKIIVHYKSEAACLRDLLVDSIRMVIVTRGLTEDEQQFFTDSLKYKPASVKVANDAVAVLVNKNSPDSTFTMKGLIALLEGKSTLKKQVVFDGNSATSTVRYAIDSVLMGRSLSPDVQAASSSNAVIDYVSKNIDAVGFVGVSWVGDKFDLAQQKRLENVKISWIECTSCKQDTFVRPVQLNIATKQYPLVRGLYYILTEKHDGLGRGFGNFLLYEPGQLIFRRAFLVPTNISFYIRDVKI
jgi:phosphate transport system substrate-binding protein